MAASLQPATPCRAGRAPAPYDGAVTTTVVEPAPPEAGTTDTPPPRGLRERLVPPMPSDGLWGWGGPLLVTLLAGVLRFWDLGKPHAVMFDETYYAKDAWSLLHFGYERSWTAGANDQILAGNTAVRGPNAPLQSTAEYVVHPPIGKWVIALGEKLFGLTPFGWRFSVALLGTIAVPVLCRVGRRMFRSTLLGCLAGLVLAVDGLALVMDRTALLDGILTSFVLFGFGALVLDRDWGRARLADAVEAAHPPGSLGIGARIEGRGPRLWWRPWRLVAGVLFGLACGTKWNGVFFLLAFLVMVVVWDFGARKALGVRNFRTAALREDLWPTLLVLLVVPFVVYVASWTGWIVHWGPESGYYRNWAAGQGPATLPFLGVHLPLVPDWARSLWHYQYEAYEFNRHLETPHPYQSNPWGWLFLARPVAVYYQSVKAGPSCSSGNCSSAITALGNPLVWWGGTLAIFYSVWRWLAHRDWRGGAIACGVAAGLLPWFLFQNRTIFSFYAIVLVPFLALALAQAAGGLLGTPDPLAADGPGVGERVAAGRATVGSVVVAAYVAATVLLTAYFWPVLTGEVIPYADWLRRMWFRSWI